ncbi:hypothetical protein BpHYR1_034522 [Brachionus plicatilis]|uniref:Uncharacterized protein n=1 Tax=Brachionus plicatilis TaxID=10195 RepID=A0A3M7PZJ2_BRAPC|nr:hypothetical protein BpHYR1_034522 [Brachionus plicatilis]
MDQKLKQLYRLRNQLLYPLQDSAEPYLAYRGEPYQPYGRTKRIVPGEPNELNIEIYEYNRFVYNVIKFYEQEKESKELIQSLINYSRENMYHLTVHEFFKRQNNN